MSRHVAVVASSDVFGGAEANLIDLYRGLVERYGVKVTLVGDVAGWPEDLGDRVSLGAPPKLTRRIPIARQASGTIPYLQRARRAALRLKGVDAYHVQYVREKLFLPKLLARHAPVLWTEHGALAPNFPPGAVPLLRSQSSASTVLAVSSIVTESLAEAGIVSKTIWNPLPSFENQSDLRSPGSPITVMYAGRLHAAKRVNLLLEAARLLPQVRTIIAGTGGEAEALRRSAPPNVEFVGHATDVAALMRRVDAVILPSGSAAREGSPLSVLEARSLGIPSLVAADCHAAAEAMDLGGELFQPEAGALAQAISGIRTGAPRVEVAPQVRAQRSRMNWLGLYNAVLEGTSPPLTKQRKGDE